MRDTKSNNENVLTRLSGILLFLVIFLFTIFSGIRLATSRTQDFSIFYYASQDIVHRISPYTDKTLFTVFNYPIVTAVFFIPFTLLPYAISQALFLFFNIGAVFISVFVCLKMLQQKITVSSYLFIVGLALLAFPTKFTFGMGQTNLIAYTFLLTGFYAFKHYSKSALLFLLLAFFLKPILGFTFLVFLFQKKWNDFFALVFIFFVIFVGAPFLLNQPIANTQFFFLLTHQSLLGREVYYNQGLLGFVSRLTQNLQIRAIAESLGILGTVVLLGYMWKRHMNRNSLLAILLTVLVIIDPLSWQHHFVFLLFPFIFTWKYIKKTKNSLFTNYILLATSYLLVAGNIKTPDIFVTFPLSLVLSNQFYGACLLLVLELFVVRKYAKRWVFL